MVAAFAADGGALPRRLRAVRAEAGISAAVSPLRVLDVIAWMGHQAGHQDAGCAGRPR
ncbi:MAG: hypothetical protein AVDCRST_MAG41-4079 [uncultured Corynebacteriales bacterium]|uniref:Uncharacterized protein n=1 Tax=uncultured Mycobacteriales bacterium TaxID=581187 RepID=A0A6J4JTR1_9ACTN|nr:MAG: hypothetical protein AVDCRST_MAG41-4079 [uncultured Corynebacteriales bacterium]